MEQDMLDAAWQAAWAAQSAGEAAWWSLAVNGVLAALTLVTLLSTIRIASATGREAKDKDATYLVGLQTILLKIKAAAEVINFDGDKVSKQAKSALTVYEDSEIFPLYNSVDMRHIRTDQALAAYLNGKVAIHQMRFHLRVIARDPNQEQIASVRTALKNITSCADVFETEASLLKRRSRFERLLGH